MRPWQGSHSQWCWPLFLSNPSAAVYSLPRRQSAAASASTTCLLDRPQSATVSAPCCGVKVFILIFYGKQFKWTMLLADVKLPILGLDFLWHFNLLADPTANKILFMATTAHSPPCSRCCCLNFLSNNGDSSNYPFPVLLTLWSGLLSTSSPLFTCSGSGGCCKSSFWACSCCWAELLSAS
jgi:hypothetical protein